MFNTAHCGSISLQRRVSYADYAYCNPDRHENIANMCEEAVQNMRANPSGSHLDEDLGLEWDEDVGIPDGESPVTWRNVHAYAQRRARWEMVEQVRAELTMVRQGIYDVLRPEDLAEYALTADDLQLLLSGSGSFLTTEDFRKVTSFTDGRTSGLRDTSPERLGLFEALFYEAIALLGERPPPL